MLTLAAVVRRHGPGYLERYGASVLPSHARALFDITHCRTAALGGHVAECTQCGREHVLYHSCRNRACPQCGYDAATKWLAKQKELLLPVPYFHVVFTLPAELRRLVRSHQQELRAVLFRAAFDSLAELCADSHFLGANIGRVLGARSRCHRRATGDGTRPADIERRRRRSGAAMIGRAQHLSIAGFELSASVCAQQPADAKWPCLGASQRAVSASSATPRGRPSLVVPSGRTRSATEAERNPQVSC